MVPKKKMIDVGLCVLIVVLTGVGIYKLATWQPSENTQLQALQAQNLETLQRVVQLEDEMSRQQKILMSANKFSNKINRQDKRVNEIYDYIFEQAIEEKSKAASLEP